MQVKPTPPLAVHRCWRSSVAWLLTAQAYPFITIVVGGSMPTPRIAAGGP